MWASVTIIGIRHFSHPCVSFMSIRDLQALVSVRIIDIRDFRHPRVSFMSIRDLQVLVSVRIIYIRDFRHPYVSFMGSRDTQASVSVWIIGIRDFSHPFPSALWATGTFKHRFLPEYLAAMYCRLQASSALLTPELRTHYFLSELLTEGPLGDSMCQNCWQQIL
jgi:hypothetical protein